MTFIILFIIIISIYLIYITQLPKVKVIAKERVRKNMEKYEDYLLSNLQTSHLKDYLSTEKTLFDIGKKNFIRLNERFKHDEIKLEQITKDWFDYMEAVKEIVFESEMLDLTFSNEEAEEHRKKQQELFIRIQEINKRIGELLGNEYINPDEFLK